MPDSFVPTSVLDCPGVTIPLNVSPEQAFAAFRADPYTAWLDSAGPITARSRYSYLAVDPFDVFTTNVFDRLADALRRFAQPSPTGAPAHSRLAPNFAAPDFALPDPALHDPALPDPALHDPAAHELASFTGGAIGFLGYELGATLEPVPRHPAPPGLPDASIGLYDVVLAFDRKHNTAWLHASGLPETDPNRRATRAAARAQATLDRLAHATSSAPGTRSAPARSAPIPQSAGATATATADPSTPPSLHWHAETSRAVHEARIVRTIAYIAAGDIYQANITAAFHAARPATLAAADIHNRLRAASPAPFGAFLSLGHNRAIASVSPERFLSVSSTGQIEARPIKGTRPRHPDPATDAALRAELLASPKDHAENLMIVDLLRHDISRVAEIGSVHVPQLAAAESFANVHHLVSVVRGQLRPGATAVDLLRAAFPGGSITGAPKHRAQQIIHELEPAARGPYCGAVVWLGWDGAMDSAIAIRTATITPDRVTIQAGGGIVADSDPAAEYEEMLVKARPLLQALASKAVPPCFG